jgi:hypothetical protein
LLILPLSLFAYFHCPIPPFLRGSRLPSLHSTQVVRPRIHR